MNESEQSKVHRVVDALGTDSLPEHWPLVPSEMTLGTQSIQMGQEDTTWDLWKTYVLMDLD